VHSSFLYSVPFNILLIRRQLFEVFESINNQSLDKLNGIVRNATWICTFVYISVGFFGYVAFCTHTFSGKANQLFDAFCDLHIWLCVFRQHSGEFIDLLWQRYHQNRFCAVDCFQLSPGYLSMQGQSLFTAIQKGNSVR